MAALEVLINSLTPVFSIDIPTGGTSEEKEELVAFLRSPEFKRVEEIIAFLMEKRAEKGQNWLSNTSPFAAVLKELCLNRQSNHFYKVVQKSETWYSEDSFLNDLELFVKDLVDTPTEDWYKFDGNAYKLFIKAHLLSESDIPAHKRDIPAHKRLCLGLVQLIVTMGGFIKKHASFSALICNNRDKYATDSIIEMGFILQRLDSIANGTSSSKGFRILDHKLNYFLHRIKFDEYLCRKDFDQESMDQESMTDTRSDEDFCSLRVVTF